MASIPCTIYLQIPTPSSSPRSFEKLRSPFLAITKRIGWIRSSQIRAKVAPSTGWRSATCFFRFGNRGAEDAGIYGSQSRDDFDRDDVEQYFNYMGMLAVEGTYDKMEALLSQNIHPVDILLMLASSEGDTPKIEELLRAGAKYDIKDADGRTALDRAATDEIKELILGFSAQKA
ncbi:protein LHCP TRANSLOCATION DEFECT-like [Typha angustifolia]|uniref:protein LHCP TRANSLOCATION DEFECT-like n=1 Tax=Typha angustifolia TaxID=59011 RepID=UPI003C2BCF52